MISLLKKSNIINIVLTLLILLLIVNTVISYFSGKSIERNHALRAQTDQVRVYMNAILYDIIHGADLAARGYAVTKNPQLVDPLNKALANKDSIFNNLESILSKQNYNLETYQEMKKASNDYLQFTQYMISVAEKDSTALFLKLLNEDRGYDWWKKFKVTRDSLFLFEDRLNLQAQEKSESAFNRNTVGQILILLLGIPALIFVINRLTSEEKKRNAIVSLMEENNRKYIFDSGDAVTLLNPENLTKQSIANYQIANLFIAGISKGDYEVQWQGLTESNRPLNLNTLAGKMESMRDQLKSIKLKEDKQLWANEGLTKFSEIVRNNQNTLGDLTNHCIRFLCNYLTAQQGSLFIPEGGEDAHLKLAACFAFDKKKYIEKRIEIGNGLLGQTYLEGQTVLMTQVPQKYLEITSGLGHANPTCLIIVPMKYNGSIECILELASFKILEKHEIDFLEKAGVFLASALMNTKTASRMQMLLDKSQEQTEQMRAAEEEMRQNLEELQTIQEQLQRREKEQVQEIERLNYLHEKNAAWFKRLSLVADNTDNSVVITDQDGKIEYVNKGFIKLTGYTLEEVTGKKPGDFLQGELTNQDTVARIRKCLAERKPVYEEILNYGKSGEEYWISLAINPIFENEQLTNYISIQADVTKTKLAAIEFTSQLNAIGKNNAVIEFNLNGTIKLANEKFLQVMGYTMKEIEGKHHRMFVYEEEGHSKAYAQMWEDLSAGKSLTGEFKRKSKTGEEVWLNGTYTVILDLNGKPYKVIKFAQDITEQKRKTLDFEGQANAIDNTMASIEFTVDGSIVHANNIFLREMGYELAELMGKHHRMFVTADYAESEGYKKFWKDLGNGLSQSGEFERINKDNKIVWLNASYTPIKDTEGKVYKIIKFAQVITKEKLKAIDSDSKMNAIDKAYSVIEFDTRGVIQRANKNFLDLTGYHEKELEGRHHSVFVNEQEGVPDQYAEFWKKLNNGELIKGEFSWVSKQGEDVLLFGTYFGVNDHKNKPYKIISFSHQIKSEKERIKSII